MNVLFTLDYELFLGSDTGTVENCLIKPLDLMTSVDDGRYSLKFTIFVDAVYLFKLYSYKDIYPSMADDLKKISKHLRLLQSSGHDIQLHIHPHWYYSEYNGKFWLLDNNHYKLSDLSEAEASTIFKKSKLFLDSIIGKKTTVFRAGGFSAQPTVLLKHLFDENGINVDSSVCPGMSYCSSHQEYDYTSVPEKDVWYFCDDICKESNTGVLEVPIGTYKLLPIFWWKYVVTRIFKESRHTTYGDGISVRATESSVMERLTKKSTGLVTIDGYKISYLKKAYDEYKKKEHNYFCVIGHPKLATPYSIKKMKEICSYMNDSGDKFITISELCANSLQ